MVDAIRAVSVERGIDPRRFTLVAGGGAGALHAGRLARDARASREVLVPREAGTFCAFGMTVTDVRHDHSAVRSTPRPRRSTRCRRRTSRRARGAGARPSSRAAASRRPRHDRAVGRRPLPRPGARADDSGCGRTAAIAACSRRSVRRVRRDPPPALHVLAARQSGRVPALARHRRQRGRSSGDRRVRRGRRGRRHGHADRHAPRVLSRSSRRLPTLPCSTAAHSREAPSSTDRRSSRVPRPRSSWCPASACSLTASRTTCSHSMADTDGP